MLIGCAIQVAPSRYACNPTPTHTKQHNSRPHPTAPSAPVPRLVRHPASAALCCAIAAHWATWRRPQALHQRLTASPSGSEAHARASHCGCPPDPSRTYRRQCVEDLCGSASVVIALHHRWLEPCGSCSCLSWHCVFVMCTAYV